MIPLLHRPQSTTAKQPGPNLTPQELRCRSRTVRPLARRAGLYAAGAVLWRPGSAGFGRPVEIAVIHRPRYDDWSLPKGSGSGRDRTGGAVREILEETGRANLGRWPLTVIHLTDFEASRRCTHRAARSTVVEFNPGSEVDVSWILVTGSDAMNNKLDYAQDRKSLVPVR